MELISDRYEILGLDSEENIVSGKLYKARDLLEGVFVYIQLIKDNIYMNEKFLPNLIDEAVILNEINSNNIARVLDLGIYLGSEERYFYIVNEYFSGIELKKLLMVTIWIYQLWLQLQIKFLKHWKKLINIIFIMEV